MKKTVTKKITGLLVLLFAFISFASFAQTEKTKQQKQDEQGAALKKWFDGGEIIVEGHVENFTSASFVNSFGQNEGYLCNKVKITRVLKGNIMQGFINIKTPGHVVCGNCDNSYLVKHPDPEYPMGYEGVTSWGNFIVIIKKTDIKGECFTSDNAGIYTVVGNAKGNDKVTLEAIQQYCGVDMGLPKIEKKSPNDNLYKERLKLYRKKHEERQKNKANKTASSGTCSIYISEYLDGQNSNNAVEIYNATSSPIALSPYKLLIYHNGSLTPTTIALTGTISAYSTHVVAQQGASAAILAHANQTTSNLNFSGDVVTVLSKGNTHIDIIGEIGVANAAGNWTLTPSGGTNNSDIRRNYNIGQGDTVWLGACQGEWTAFSEDSISNIGTHKNHCAVDPDLNIYMSNGADSSGYFVFDVYAYSTGNSGTWFDGASVNILYNTSAFTPNIYNSGGVTISQNTTIFSSSIYQTVAEDVGYDTLGINISTITSLTAPARIFLTTTPVKLYHVKLKEANCGVNANLSFTNFSIYFFSDYTDNQTDLWYTGTPYDTTYWTGSYNTPITCSGLQITSISPNSVIAGADYGTSQTGESLLTINGNGFGNQIGTVYMANAVNNSPPLYVPLDKYDIVNWADNQIKLLVPSVLFPYSITPSKPNSNYPGTGYIYVKPFSATDSVSSSTLGTGGIVNIPYALKNISLSSGGIPTNKERISFAYRQFFSTTSFNTDTSAYDFRFDVATVTHNTQPNGGTNCRTLLKQTIEDWACKIPIKYRIGRDTTITTSVPDGISYITFKSGIGTDTLSSPSFAAETIISVNSCTGGSGYSYATEADVSFNSTANWYYVSPSLVPNNTPNPNMQGTPFADFFTTALHEFGHASLLLHVNQTSDLMYFHIPSTSGTGPYISSDDEAGGLDNKNWSKTLSLGSCPFNAFTIPASGATTCVDPETGLAGIEQIGNGAFQVSIYPNPAADYLNVTFTKQTESSNTIKLTNTLGQTVFYSNIGKNEGAQEVINTSQLAKGMYILTVTDNANTVTKKIIVE